MNIYIYICIACPRHACSPEYPVREVPLIRLATSAVHATSLRAPDLKVCVEKAACKKERSFIQIVCVCVCVDMYVFKYIICIYI